MPHHLRLDLAIVICGDDATVEWLEDTQDLALRWCNRTCLGHRDGRLKPSSHDLAQLARQERWPRDLVVRFERRAIVRRKEDDEAAGLRDPQQFADRAGRIGHMLDELMVRAPDRSDWARSPWPSRHPAPGCSSMPDRVRTPRCALADRQSVGVVIDAPCVVSQLASRGHERSATAADLQDGARHRPKTGRLYDGCDHLKKPRLPIRIQRLRKSRSRTASPKPKAACPFASKTSACSRNSSIELALRSLSGRADKSSVSLGDWRSQTRAMPLNLESCAMRLPNAWMSRKTTCGVARLRGSRCARAGYASVGAN